MLVVTQQYIAETGFAFMLLASKCQAQFWAELGDGADPSPCPHRSGLGWERQTVRLSLRRYLPYQVGGGR